jgi:hypothetical protein
VNLLCLTCCWNELRLAQLLEGVDVHLDHLSLVLVDANLGAYFFSFKMPSSSPRLVAVLLTLFHRLEKQGNCLFFLKNKETVSPEHVVVTW